MTKQEFETVLGQEVTQKDYEIIEFVYTWYPTLSSLSIEAKEQIAKLYNLGGLPLMQDMKGRAEKAKVLEAELHAAGVKLSELKENYEALKEGRDE